MLQPKIISIIGCGWLGQPLAVNLIRAGHVVKGSTTRQSKLTDLTRMGIIGFQLAFTPDPSGSMEFFSDCQVLIINIPPRRNPDVETFYPAIVENIISSVPEQERDLKILFISSTSVYPMVNREINEHDHLKADKPPGIALQLAEELLFKRFSSNLTILRFGGLVGYDRGPISILRKGDKIRNPETPLNLIHRDDCIEIIKSIISGDFWGYRFNAVADQHPLRRDYYNNIAMRGKLPPPVFVEDDKQAFKIVSNTYLKKTLSYNFIHPDPMELT
jgi:nucleoside-diphosphate-sugar epimerase